MSTKLEITGRLGLKSTQLCVKMPGFDEFCTPSTYVRGVSFPGRVADCPHEYTNIGLTCVRPPDIIGAPSRVADCPDGYTNMGVTCNRGNNFYWASSHLAHCPGGFANMGEFCGKVSWSGIEQRG